MDHKSKIQNPKSAIVGGGPAGVVAAYLLARQGVEVVLLEAQKDFDRAFRGDTIHPATMELLDTLGLADRLLERPHVKARRAEFISVDTGEGAVLADFSRLRTRFPYITLMPQTDFLTFMTEAAAAFPGFRLEMGANVRELIEADGRVVGVRYRQDGEMKELRAPLIIGADGRASRLRKAGGFTLKSFSVPMDVLWFHLSRHADDPGAEAVTGRIGGGGLLILLDRFDHWQIGYVFPKDGYRRLREAGLDAFRAALASRVPWLENRVDELEEWKQIALLTVQSGRVETWYRPGLLLIGDAAHIMSPVGGVGINYAVQDAVEAAEVLSAPLLAGEVAEAHLAEVQRRRMRATRVIQRFQALAQERIVRRAFRANRPFRLPFMMRVLPRLPLLRTLLARLIAFGVGQERLGEGPP